MGDITHKIISVSYKLYTEEDGEQSLAEVAPAANPFVFMTGFGTVLEPFEQAVEGLKEGEPFKVRIEKEQAFGEYMEERVVDLPRETFQVNGKFDGEHVRVNMMIPLQNEEGEQFMGLVEQLTATTVTVNLNHPFAGKALIFEGEVVATREATEKEVMQTIKQLSGEGCGGCGGKECSGGCEGGCGGCN